MRTFRYGVLAVVAGGLLLSTAARAEDDESKSSSSSRRESEDSENIGKVRMGGSDAASLEFQRNVLPGINSFLNLKLGETRALKNSSAMMLDPSKLLLQNESQVRIYFVGEGAGYHNTLGYNAFEPGETLPKTPIASDGKVIFPDASSQISLLGDAVKNPKRTTSDPLLPGDFVDLGYFDKGVRLDFWLIANGASGGRTAYSTDPARNPDRINHVVSFALPDSPYLIIGFEDLLGGGDMDFNDVLFAVDIGKRNVRGLVGAPEPAIWAVLLGFLWIARHYLRRDPKEVLGAAAHGKGRRA